MLAPHFGTRRLVVNVRTTLRVPLQVFIVASIVVCPCCDFSLQSPVFSGGGKHSLGIVLFPSSGKTRKDILQETKPCSDELFIIFYNSMTIPKFNSMNIPKT